MSETYEAVQTPPADFVGAVFDATGLEGPLLKSAASELWNIAVRPRIVEPKSEREQQLDQDVWDNQDRTYRAKVRRVADDLRQLAEDIERVGNQTKTVREPNVPDYSRAVGEVLHAFHWGVANMNLDVLVRYAFDADQARLKRDA